MQMPARLTVGALAALTLTLASACGAGSGGGSTSTDMTISIALPAVSTLQTELYLAQQMHV